MGWTNFVIVDRLKLAIEISRHIHDLEDYEEESLNYVTEEKDIIDVSDIKFTSLSLKDLASLVTISDKVGSINGFEIDKLMLYWLKSRGIEYEIESEHDVDINELKERGYTIKRLFESTEKEEDKNDQT